MYMVVYITIDINFTCQPSKQLIQNNFKEVLNTIYEYLNDN